MNHKQLQHPEMGLSWLLPAVLLCYFAISLGLIDEEVGLHEPGGEKINAHVPDRFRRSLAQMRPAEGKRVALVISSLHELSLPPSSVPL